MVSPVKLTLKITQADELYRSSASQAKQTPFMPKKASSIMMTQNSSSNLKDRRKTSGFGMKRELSNGGKKDNDNPGG